MKYLFRCSVFFIVATVVSFSFLRAAVPDEDLLVAQISSSKSDNYYPNLMLRYNMGDTTLTLDNYHHLYYGFAYQEEYKPLAVNPHMDKLFLLASGIDLEQPHSSSLYDIVETGHDALKYDPFNVEVWNLMAYAYGALGNREREYEASRRVEMILSVIDNSGGGLKQSDPKHVLMFSHALAWMGSENLRHNQAIVVSRTVEYIALVAPRKVDGQKIKGFYFDFGRVYWNKPDSVTYKRDRTWQFNNLPPKEYK